MDSLAGGCRTEPRSGHVGPVRGRIPSEAASVEQILFLFEADADSNIDRFVDAADTQLPSRSGYP